MNHCGDVCSRIDGLARCRDAQFQLFQSQPWREIPCIAQLVLREDSLSVGLQPHYSITRMPILKPVGTKDVCNIGMELQSG